MASEPDPNEKEKLTTINEDAKICDAEYQDQFEYANSTTGSNWSMSPQLSDTVTSSPSSYATILSPECIPDMNTQAYGTNNFQTLQCSEPANTETVPLFCAPHAHSHSYIVPQTNYTPLRAFGMPSNHAEAYHLLIYYFLTFKSRASSINPLMEEQKTVESRDSDKTISGYSFADYQTSVGGFDQDMTDEIGENISYKTNEEIQEVTSSDWEQNMALTVAKISSDEMEPPICNKRRRCCLEFAGEFSEGNGLEQRQPPPPPPAQPPQNAPPAQPPQNAPPAQPPQNAPPAQPPQNAPSAQPPQNAPPTPAGSAIIFYQCPYFTPLPTATTPTAPTAPTEPAASTSSAPPRPCVILKTPKGKGRGKRSKH